MATKPAVELHCSLPMIALRTAGFVDFPSGTFRADPTAPADLLSGGYVYAWGLHRWAKAPFGTLEFQALSPDGTKVASIEAPTATSPAGYVGVDVMDLKSGSSRHVGQVPGRGARIIAFRDDGIYLTNGLVYRMNPTTGALTLIGPKGSADATSVNRGLWFWVTATAVWSSLLPAPNQGDRDSVLSLSLTDGTLRTWYTAPATRAVSIIGFVTPSEPLVVEYGNDQSHRQMTDFTFMLLTAPGLVNKLTFDPSFVPSPWGITDTQGVWLSTAGHVWLYDEQGYESMADIGSAIGQGVAPTPVGTCH